MTVVSHGMTLVSHGMTLVITWDDSGITWDDSGITWDDSGITWDDSRHQSPDLGIKLAQEESEGGHLPQTVRMETRGTTCPLYIIH